MALLATSPLVTAVRAATAIPRGGAAMITAGQDGFEMIPKMAFFNLTISPAAWVQGDHVDLFPIHGSWVLVDLLVCHTHPLRTASGSNPKSVEVEAEIRNLASDAGIVTGLTQNTEMNTYNAGWENIFDLIDKLRAGKQVHELHANLKENEWYTLSLFIRSVEGTAWGSDMSVAFRLDYCVPIGG